MTATRRLAAVETALDPVAIAVKVIAECVEYEVPRSFGDAVREGIGTLVTRRLRPTARGRNRPENDRGDDDAELVNDAAQRLARGKRLFKDFTRSLDLEHLGVRQSRYATFIDYAVFPRPGFANHPGR